MSHSSPAVSSRITQQVKRWLTNRWQECVRCSECEQPVLPFDSLCSNCGQANPAKVSVWAGVYLVATVVMVAALGMAMV